MPMTPRGRSVLSAEIPFVLEGLVEAQWLKEWTPASA
jgi:hypothetical protein